MSAVKLDDARRVISAAEKKEREIGQPKIPPIVGAAATLRTGNRFE